MYFIGSDEYLRSCVFAHFYILSAARRRWLFSTWYLFIQLYIRVLYLLSHFTFPCANAASNHKSQANPRIFVAYTLSSYKEHRFLLSRLISPYVFPYVHAARYFHGVCFFTPRRRKIVQEETRILPRYLDSYRVTFAICRFRLSCLPDMPFVSFGCSRHHRRRDVNAVLRIYDDVLCRRYRTWPFIFKYLAPCIPFSNHSHFI